MSELISIDTLRHNAEQARLQAKQHENNMNAALGAAQAYEQLLGALLKARREAVEKAEAEYQAKKAAEDSADVFVD